MDAATVVPDVPADGEWLLEAAADGEDEVKEMELEMAPVAAAAPAGAAPASAAAAVDVAQPAAAAAGAAAAAAQPAALPPSSAQLRALRRQASMSFQSMEPFMQWFIEEHSLLPGSRINADVILALDRHSSKLKDSPGSATLAIELRKALKQAQ